VNTTEAVISLGALAQESRLALFRLLVKRGPEGFTPTQLAEKLGLPSPTLSFHLKELQRAELIQARRDGRFLYYSPQFSRMSALIAFLTDNCCALADKECGPACGPAYESTRESASKSRRRRA
jgi:ArsR family transcriptional regulator